MDRSPETPLAPTAEVAEPVIVDDGLIGRSVRGGVAALGTQAAKLLLNLVSVAVLSRLLTPSDFGLVAMVFAITEFLGIFKDLGLSAATIQSRTITAPQRSTLFWLNGTAGGVFALLLAAGGPAIAKFFADPRLSDVARISALAFPPSGFATQHRALLTRRMQFGRLMVVDLTAAIGSTALAIALAVSGAGWVALAVVPVASALINLAGVVLSSGWIPGRPGFASGTRALVRYGGDVSTFNVISYFARNFDNILIGRYWGSQALGLYSRAYSVLLFPIRQISGPLFAVAFPALSSLQSDPKRFRNYYLNVLFLTTAVTTPLYATLAILAPEAIQIVLGSQWADAAGIFRFLAVSALALPIANTSEVIYISLGNNRMLVRAGAIGTGVLVAAFCLGLPFGARGVAAAYAAAMLLWVFPCMWLAVRDTPIRLSDVFRTALDPLMATVPGALWLIGVRLLAAPRLPLWLWLIVGVSGTGLLYAVTLCGFLKKGRLLMRLAKEALGRAEPIGRADGSDTGGALLRSQPPRPHSASRLSRIFGGGRDA